MTVQPSDLRPEIDRAILSGLNSFTIEELTAAMNNHPLIETTVDEAAVKSARDCIAADIETVAEAIAESFYEQHDWDTTALQPTTRNAQVATDGGGLFSEATCDSFIVTAAVINSINLGAFATIGDERGAAFAAVILAILMTSWFVKKYDITIAAKE